MTHGAKQIVALGLVAVACVAGESRLIVLSLVPPDYPPLALMARLQGRVTLDIQIMENGHVGQVEASGGHRLLQREAERNVRQWVFGNFARRTKFPIRHRIVYIYRMEGDARSENPTTLVLHLPDTVEIVTNPSIQYDPPDGDGRARKPPR